MLDFTRMSARVPSTPHGQTMPDTMEATIEGTSAVRRGEPLFRIKKMIVATAALITK